MLVLCAGVVSGAVSFLFFVFCKYSCRINIRRLVGIGVGLNAGESGLGVKVVKGLFLCGEGVGSRCCGKGSAHRVVSFRLVFGGVDVGVQVLR